MSSLGSEYLRTLLMVVLRNATTDSPWPVSNNPAAKYNAPDRKDSNLNIPLWQLVRGSTAAPTYFPPEVVKVGEQEFIFVDGGMTITTIPLFNFSSWRPSKPTILRGQPVKRKCYSSLSALGPIRRRMQISRLDR